MRLRLDKVSWAPHVGPKDSGPPVRLSVDNNRLSRPNSHIVILRHLV